MHQMINNVYLSITDAMIQEKNYDTAIVLFEDVLKWDPIVYKRNVPIHVPGITPAEKYNIITRKSGRTYFKKLISEYPEYFYYFDTKTVDLILLTLMDYENEKPLFTMSLSFKQFLINSLEHFLLANNYKIDVMSDIYMKVVQIPTSIKSEDEDNQL